MSRSQVIASVIIPCRNEVNHIEFVIESIQKNSLKEVEIIIVDGMSTDGTREKIAPLIQKDTRIRLIDNLLQVTPVAFNLGIKNASGQFIFIVGARHILELNYLETCVRILNERPEIGCVGGKVNNTFENQNSFLIAKAMSSPFAVGGGNFRILEKDALVDTVGTPAYRKSIFDEVGYFDEELLRNQDDEFNYRVIKKGYKILFTAQTSIKYFVRANFSNLYRQYFQYGYWKVYVNKKHSAITTMRQLVPMLFILFLAGGAALAALNLTFLYLYLACLSVYLLAAFCFALQKANGLTGVSKIMFTFFILHFSYGSGYLKGILDFFVFGRSIRKSEALSR